MAKKINFTRKQLETAMRMINEYRDLNKQFNYHLEKVCFYFHPSTPKTLYIKATYKHYENGEMYADYFGRKSIGMILGLSGIIIMIGQMRQRLRDHYRSGFTVLAGLAGLGSVFFWLARKPQAPAS